MRLTSFFLFMCVAAGLLHAQAPNGIDGAWHFVMDTEGGERQADATFHVDGSSVTGKWEKSDVKGTFAGGKLDLAFPMYSDEGGFSATFKVKGQVDGAGLKGQWEFGQYTGTYVAKKKE